MVIVVRIIFFGRCIFQVCLPLVDLCDRSGVNGSLNSHSVKFTDNTLARAEKMAKIRVNNIWV